MEYIEMSAAPKGMFDKLISNDGSRVPFITNGSVPTGFRTMPVPLFSHAKPLSSTGMVPAAPSGSGSDLSRRGVTSSFVTSGMSPNGSYTPLGNAGNGSSGTIHQVPGESGSSQQEEDMVEKGKRSKGEGGKAGRGGGTFSRKRSRGVQGDSQLMSEAVPDGSLSGGAATSTGRPATGDGNRQIQNSNPDKGDKCMSRRQSTNSGKRGDKKQTLMVATSVTDAPPPRLVEANGAPNNLNGGILDVYGLRTRAMDVSRFMVDIPVNDLLSGNFEVPSFYLKDNHDAKVEPEEGFEQQIESILHFLPKRAINGENHSLKNNEVAGSLNAKGSKNMKMMLDLENPLHPEEDDVPPPNVGKTDKETQSDATLEAGVDREGSTKNSTDGAPSTAAPSKFSFDSLPVHSVEFFLSKLNLVPTDPKLVPSDPFPSLMAQAGDGEMSAAVDIHVGSDIVDLCRRSGSIPPLLFSGAYIGPMKDNGKYNPRIWFRGPAENGGWKGGSGLNGKEGSDGAGDDGSNSPSSRLGKVDSKYKVQSPDAMQRSTSRASSMSPSQIDPSSIPNAGHPINPVKEEPRQVENAVGFSSGDLKPMEIDSSRLDSGSVIGSGADATDVAQAIPEDRQRSGGEAVRPLETPASLAGPQEMDTSSDWQGKPSADTLPEVTREKAEQKAVMKDPDEGDSSKTKVPSGPSGLPVVDLKITVRGPSPQIDSSTLAACPSSPGAEGAARILVSMANSTLADAEKIEVERKRRVFQPYPGAPSQKTVKSVRITNSSAALSDGVREARRSLDGGSVPPSKALVSERRKSLSQVNDASEKPSYSSPRNSGGISTGSRGGIHTGARSNTLSIKLEKVAGRDSIKEPTSSKEAGRGSSSLPPLSHGGPPLKNGLKGVKTGSFLQSSTSKGSVTAATISKVPAASTAQRVGNGGTSSRSSRTGHGNSPGSHSVAPVPFKSSRQGIPDSRQKMKSELSGRGGKPN